MWRRWPMKPPSTPHKRGVGIAGAHHGGGDDGGVGADHGARGIGRDAAAAGRLDIEVDIFAIARVFLRVDEDEIAPRPDRQPEALEPRLDHRGRPIRIGCARPSSATTWVARSTRSSSPSA